MVYSPEELKEKLVSIGREDILSVDIHADEVNLIASKDHIVDLLSFLRDDKAFRFIQLMDLCGVDYPSRIDRFEVVYHLMSLHKNLRLRIKLAVKEDETVPSVTSVFPVANWFEREAFDMYGILFSGHPDLRRILTDYGFEGYPLRKDFPVTGHVELRYDDEQKRVVYDKVSLAQDFRSFDFLSPWEGAAHILDKDATSKKEGA